jgi:hypothetical protein
MTQRPPDLAEGRKCAAKLVGETEALHLTVTRPQGILMNRPPSEMPAPSSGLGIEKVRGGDKVARSSGDGKRASFGQRVRRLFG